MEHLKKGYKREKRLNISFKKSALKFIIMTKELLKEDMLGLYICEFRFF